MADRSVTVRLRAEVGQYVQGMRQSERATAEFAGTTVRQGESARTKLKNIATEAGLINPAMLGIAGAAALATKAVSTFANFDQAMSQVAAATGESAENMDLLRDAAVDAGASTAFSATEAASAIEALAKAGVSTADILGGGLAGALDLAAAGGLDVGNAAEIAATAMTQFKLAGDDMTHVADLLAAGAGKAQGDVSDLAQALNQSGLVAQQTGLSIEETTAALAAFASAGLLGSDAGTSFKTMLQRLSAPSGEAADLMGELGIAAYDAQGNFVGLAGFAGQLEAALGTLTPAQRNAALATIFGSDAVRAAAVLYDEGRRGVERWTEAVDDQGYAAEQSAARLDNLRGDLEELGGALETLFIEGGEHADGFLRQITQAATGLARFVSDWDNATSSFQAESLEGLGFEDADEIVSLFDLIDAAAQRARGTLNDPSFGAGFNAWWEDLRANIPGLAQQTIGVAEATEDVGEAAGTASTSGRDLDQTFEDLKVSAEAQTKAINELRKSYFDLMEQALGIRDAERDYQAALDGAQEVFLERARLTEELAAAERDLRAAEDAHDRERIREQIAKLNAELAEQSTTLDITAEAGRRNEAALDDVAEAALGVMEQMYATGASEEEVTERHYAMRVALIKAAMQYGLTREEARTYADQVLEIPPKAETEVTADTGGARRDLTYVEQRIADVDKADATVGVYADVTSALANIRRVQAALNTLGATDVRRSIGSQMGVPGQFTSRAEGGYTPPGLALVGERGPELVRFERPAMVYTAEETARMMSGASGGTTSTETVNVTINESAGPRATGREMLTAIRDRKHALR